MVGVTLLTALLIRLFVPASPGDPTASVRGELSALKTQATSAPGATAVVGDFNSTRWNPPFGDLLAAGLHDAHESVGQGLSRSWPNLGFPVPLMRLDHALVNDKVGVVSVHDVDVPGSDHIGFVTELAVGS